MSDAATRWDVPPTPPSEDTGLPGPQPRRTRWATWTSTTRRLVAVCAAAGLVAGAAAGGVAHVVTATASPPTATGPAGAAPAGAAGGRDGAPAPLDTSKTVATLVPAVVDITTQLGYQSAAAAGTGMILTTSGEILTNNHVIDGATRSRVSVLSSGRSYPAEVMGTDRTGDIALLKIDSAGLTAIRTDAAIPNPGDQVIAMGNALGRGGAPPVTGTVTALGQQITATDANGSNPNHLTGLIQTSARLQPGDSGGPLVNNRAQVIGMNTATDVGPASTTTPDSYAIPIGRALAVARQIERGQGSATVHVGLPAFLGVDLDPQATGAVVANVVTGSPADHAGMRAGDTITSLSGAPVGSAQGLIAAIRGRRPNDRVRVYWTTAGGASRHADVTLTTGPAD